MPDTDELSAIAANLANSASFKDDLNETLAPSTSLLLASSEAAGVSAECWAASEECRWWITDKIITCGRFRRQGFRDWWERKWGLMELRSRLRACPPHGTCLLLCHMSIPNWPMIFVPNLPCGEELRWVSPRGIPILSFCIIYICFLFFSIKKYYLY